MVTTKEQVISINVITQETAASQSSVMCRCVQPATPEIKHILCNDAMRHQPSSQIVCQLAVDRLDILKDNAVCLTTERGPCFCCHLFCTL